MVAGSYQRFIRILRQDWKANLPTVKPATTSRPPFMPTASTFCIGPATDTGLTTFLVFQHASKPWEVGAFTMNVIVSETESYPTHARYHPSGEDVSGELVTRLGNLVHGFDKWWCLEKRDAEERRKSHEWWPSSHESEFRVLSEALSDVTQDVRCGLAKLGVTF